MKPTFFYITSTYAVQPFHALCVLLPSYGSNYRALLCLGIQMGKNDQKGPRTSIPSPPPAAAAEKAPVPAPGLALGPAPARALRWVAYLAAR